MLSGILIRAQAKQAAAPESRPCETLFSWLIRTISISSFGHLPTSMPRLLLGQDAPLTRDEER
jgi:hypothetical protein